MCGITGICHLKAPGPIDLDLMKKMIGALHHRGPDESGIYLDDRVGLGQARLSIIDLAGGSQPIHNEDKTLWIVYNGEVFNYIELKQYLLKKGHHFYTTSDTEVILHLYETLGPSCLDQLNGQFAFAIWDSKNKELFLARDRVGIRPLYYTVQNDRLIFASEIKSIFLNHSIARELDPAALNQIFTYWTTLPGKTAFKDIHELPPGHFLKVSHGQFRIKKYWDIPFCPPEEQVNWSLDQICEQILELLTDAIRIRLRADVPVGCYLSGGLDSSGVTALVVKNFNSRVRTYGIRFEEKNFDETTHQHRMVQFLGVDHTEIIATNQKIRAALPAVLWHCEKPLLRTAPVPLFLLSDVVNQNHFKVVLTGEGADEVFGGYNIFREAKVRHFWSRQPDSAFRGRLIRRLYPYIFNNPRTAAMQQAFFARGLDQTANPFFSHLVRWENTSRIKNYFSAEFKSAINGQNETELLRQNLPSTFEQWDYLAKAQYLEMMLFLSNYLLSSQGDRVAMAHSVEIRLPYLDYRLIDFMGRVPAKWKINVLNEKYCLKKSFEGILPESIRTRPKHPYRAPIAPSLIDKSDVQTTRDILSDTNLNQVGLFDISRVKWLLNKFHTANNAGETDNMALVGIISTLLIYDQFIINFPFTSIQPASPNLVVNQCH